MREERKFLECNLSGRSLMWPVWGVLAVGIAVALISNLYVCAGCEGTPFFPNFVVLSVVTPFVAIYLLSMLAFSITKKSAEACGFQGERAEADYVVGIYYKQVLFGALMCVVTCGLYLPWFVANFTKSLVGGISFKGVKFDFHGTGISLLAILTLAFVLPLVLLAMLFSVAIVTAPFRESLTTFIVGCVVMLVAVVVVCAVGYVLLARWMLKVSYGDKVLSANFTTFGATLFLIEQSALSILTLGLYSPMMWLRIVQYFLSATSLGEGRERVRLGMRLRSWRDWAYVWGQTLLVVVTLGIYTPWFYARLMNRFVPRIYIDSEV